MVRATALDGWQRATQIARRTATANSCGHRIPVYLPTIAECAVSCVKHTTVFDPEEDCEQLRRGDL